MENKFDPFCNKEPTPLDASLVPLAVTGFTEISYTILPDYSSLSLSSRPVQSGQSSRNAHHQLDPDYVDGQRDIKKKTQGFCQEIIDALF